MIETESHGPDQAGRRERKKQATRLALHEAALELTESLGLANVTIEAITDRVDVASRTFFNYYQSKEAAVLGPKADPDELASSVRHRLEAGSQPLDALQAALVEHLTSHGSTPEALRRRMAIVRAEPLLMVAASGQWELTSAALVGTVAEATGYDPGKDAYPALVVNVAVAAARATLMRWVQDPSLSLTSATEEAFALLRSGFHTAAAR